MGSPPHADAASIPAIFAAHMGSLACRSCCQPAETSPNGKGDHSDGRGRPSSRRDRLALSADNQCQPRRPLRGVPLPRPGWADRQIPRRRQCSVQGASRRESGRVSPSEARSVAATRLRRLPSSVVDLGSRHGCQVCPLRCCASGAAEHAATGRAKAGIERAIAEYESRFSLDHALRGCRITGDKGASMNPRSSCRSFAPRLRQAFRMVLGAHGVDPESESHMPLVARESIDDGSIRAHGSPISDTWRSALRLNDGAPSDRIVAFHSDGRGLEGARFR